MYFGHRDPNAIKELEEKRFAIGIKMNLVENKKLASVEPKGTCHERLIQENKKSKTRPIVDLKYRFQRSSNEKHFVGVPCFLKRSPFVVERFSKFFLVSVAGNKCRRLFPVPIGNGKDQRKIGNENKCPFSVYTLLATNSLEPNTKFKCSLDYVASVWTKRVYKLLFVGNVLEHIAKRRCSMLHQEGGAGGRTLFTHGRTEK